MKRKCTFAAALGEVVVAEHERTVAYSLVELAVECEHAVGLSTVEYLPSCGTVRLVECTLHEVVVGGNFRVGVVRSYWLLMNEVIVDVVELLAAVLTAILAAYTPNVVARPFDDISTSSSVIGIQLAVKP